MNSKPKSMFLRLRPLWGVIFLLVLVPVTALIFHLHRQGPKSLDDIPLKPKVAHNSSVGAHSPTAARDKAASDGTLSPKDSAALAGATATGNALELASYQARVPTLVKDSSLILELTSVSAYGFNPSNTIGFTAIAQDMQSVNQGANQNTHSDSLLPDSTLLTNLDSLTTYNLEFIDQDGDGYGVGSPLGADCDDLDPNSKGSCPSQDIANWLKLQGVGIDAKVYYVSATGNDETGQPNNPQYSYKTMKGFSDSLQPGDAVLYRQGTYLELSALPILEQSGEIGQPILLAAWPGETVTFSLSKPFTIKNVAYWTIQGFVLQAIDPMDYILTTQNSQHIEFQKIVVQEHQNIGLHIDSSAHVSINYSVFSRNGLGISVTASKQITLQNTLIYHNTTHGVHFAQASEVVIKNCIVHSNATHGLLITNSHQFTIHNNLMMQNNGNQLAVGGTSEDLSLANNTFWSRAQPALSFTHSIDAKILILENVIHSDSSLAIYFKPGLFSQVYLQKNLVYSRTYANMPIFIHSDTLGIDQIENQWDSAYGNTLFDVGFF